jgi:hypothetical protein
MGIDKISGIDIASLTDVSGQARGDIASVSGIAATSGGPKWQSTIYTFDNQTNDNQNGWTPGGTNPNYATDGWANGAAGISGTQWQSGTTSQGMNMDSGGTGSSNTGPNGGMTSYTNGTPDSSSTKKYMYKEASSGRRTFDHVVRTPGYNFSSLMTNTSNNLKMVFWYHAFGSNIIYDIYSLWTDTATTSNTTQATNLVTLPASGNTMPNGAAPYVIQEIDLNAYRTLNQTNYFWLVIGIMSSFRGDVALDSVYWEEY